MGRKPTKHLTPTQAEAARILRKVADNIADLSPARAAEVARIVKAHIYTAAAMSGKGMGATAAKLAKGKTGRKEAKAVKLADLLQNTDQAAEMERRALNWASYRNGIFFTTYEAAAMVFTLSRMGHLPEFLRLDEAHKALILSGFKVKGYKAFCAQYRKFTNPGYYFGKDSQGNFQTIQEKETTAAAVARWMDILTDPRFDNEEPETTPPGASPST